MKFCALAITTVTYLFIVTATSGTLIAQSVRTDLQRTTVIATPTASVEAQKLTFSDPPTDTEILYSGLFPEPLVPAGGSTDPDQNRALGTALLEYSHAADQDQLDPILSFIRRYPKSPWDTALLLNAGIIFRKTGHFSKALGAWETAWAGSAQFKDATGKVLGDAVLGKLALFYAYLGRMEELSALLDSVRDRSLTGAATENVANASEGLMSMHKRPQVSFRCGPLALYRIALFERNIQATRVLEKDLSTSRGTSLTQLLEFSKKAGLDYQMAYRNPGSRLLTPAVVNWKVGHYAAILDVADDLYHVGDETFGEDIQIPASTLDEEASGYFLVPAGKLPQGWRSVADAEGNKVWGRGDTGSNRTPGPGPCDPQAFPESCGSGGGCEGGMTTYNVDALPNSLELHDRLLGYKPPLGPPVNFEIFYMHRDDQQPAIFTYSNFGPKWTSNWISYIVDSRILNRCNLVGGPPRVACNSNLDTAELYLRGGGLETYTYVPGSVVSFQPGLMTQAHLTRRLTLQGQTVGFTRILPDGSQQLFDQKLGNQYFLTQVTDPQGNGVTLSYDGLMRIQTIKDAFGQVTQLVYGLASDRLKVTAVVDPFGRQATFAYSADGHLASATDTIGITSLYTWVDNDFISQLTTPYGVTRFAFGNGTTGSFDRFLTITDPLGLTSRVEFAQEVGPDTAPSVPSGINVFQNPLGFLEWRNAFVWDPHQLALATNPDGSLDYSKARIMHFLHDLKFVQLYRTAAAAPVLESVKAPLENRVYYNYPGQLDSISTGTSNKPSAVARVLDDGSTQLTLTQRNSFGHPTQIIDPVGRQRNFVYAPNDIDLISVTATSSQGNDPVSTVFQATYNDKHEPLTITNFSGETTHYTYNIVGQILTVTNALGDVTSYGYDKPHGRFLTTIQGPISAATVTLTYDPFNRVNSITDELSYTKVFNYDFANRPTLVTFPDGTTTQYTYNLLDPASVTDRLQRKTLYEHDVDRRLTSVTDPLGRMIHYSYCSCGAISGVTDAAGNTTSFTFDLENRITSTQYADGSQTFVNYEATTSRPRSVSDNHNAYAYEYYVDDTLATQGAGLSFTYDSVFRRVVRMTDSTRYPLIVPTTYKYNPTASTPTPGAGLLATEKGPYGDVLSYEYDALGRPVTTVVNGVTSTRLYDALGRVVLTKNPLGTFGYFYQGASQELVKRIGVFGSTSPTEDISYYSSLGDNLPKDTQWSSGAQVLSIFRYGYDADAEITTLGFGGTGVNFVGGTQDNTSYQLTYDAAGELMGVVPRVNGPIRVPPSPSNRNSDPPSGPKYAYSYSPAGNILSASDGLNTDTFTFNNLNQLSSAGASYDIDGNLTGLGGMSYEWLPARTSLSPRSTSLNFQLNLVSNSGGIHTRFRYDGLGRRMEIFDFTDSGPITDRRYVWCGSDLCEEHDMTAATTALPGGPVTKRYFDEGVEINGKPYFYTFDGLGSVIHLVDSTGAVSAQYQYGPYGNRIQTAGVLTGITSDIGYTGLFQEQTSGLVFAKFREYYPYIGRWLSRDPLGEVAHSYRSGVPSKDSTVAKVNLYCYALNNPLTVTDRTGLDPDSWWQVWAARAFVVWKWATGGTESAEGEPPADFSETAPSPTPNPSPGPSTSGPAPGPGGNGPGPFGPGGGSIQNVGGWFTWVPGSLCTPLIFPGHCFFSPYDPGCGGGA
jgi:RHS repeat-associated protein